jgi:hypothetical protein
VDNKCEVSSKPRFSFQSKALKIVLEDPEGLLSGKLKEEELL